jgi:hypothetical protein
MSTHETAFPPFDSPIRSSNSPNLLQRSLDIVERAALPTLFLHLLLRNGFAELFRREVSG